MAQESPDKKLIGRAERLDFPELALENVYARIDTGAKTSAIWVSDVTEKDGKLEVIFLGSSAEQYTAKPCIFDEFEKIVVASSNGQAQSRYKVRILVKIKGKKIRAWFTLADRSTQVYPVLIGRNVLAGKFIVDVKKGKALKDQERQRSQALQNKLLEHDNENI